MSSPIEFLESRRLCSASAVLHAHTLTIRGTPGDDNIVLGLSSNSLLVNLDGQLAAFPADKVKHITIQALGGNNFVNAGAFADNLASIFPGATPITAPIKILAGSGNDTLFGGNGNDTLKAGSGHDRLYGGAGNDLLIERFLSYERDSFFGQSGNDTLVGGNGDDYLDGGPGKDLLHGHAGADGFIQDNTDLHNDYHGSDNDSILTSDGTIQHYSYWTYGLSGVSGTAQLTSSGPPPTPIYIYADPYNLPDITPVIIDN